MEYRSLELLITELLKRGRNGQSGKVEDGGDPTDGPEFPTGGTEGPVMPTGGPTVDPVMPTGGPTVDPVMPTGGPTVDPVMPTGGHTIDPVMPTGGPTVDPVMSTGGSTRNPSGRTAFPIEVTTGNPSARTAWPTEEPTGGPTGDPVMPTGGPSGGPSDDETDIQSIERMTRTLIIKARNGQINQEKGDNTGAQTALPTEAPIGHIQKVDRDIEQMMNLFMAITQALHEDLQSLG